MAATSYWDGVITWLQEDPSIKGWWTDDYSTELKTLAEGTLEIWSAITLYQGFDIKKLLKQMKLAYDRYMDDVPEEKVDITITVNGKQVKETLSNHKSMMVDIEFMIFLFANRGSVWEKFTKKSHPELRVFMDWMATKYDIDITPHKANEPLAPDIVTIPRMAACFPYKICDYFHLNHGKTLVSPESLGYPSGLLPSKILLCTYVPACLPMAWIKAQPNVHLVMFLLHVLCDDVLHRKAQDITDLDVMFSYYAAAYKSNGTPERSRVSYLTNKGCASPAGTGFSQIIINAGNEAEAKIRAARPADAHLEDVIAQLKTLV